MKKWAHFSSVRFFHSVREFSLKNREKPLFNEEVLKILSSLILNEFETFAPVFRLSIYSSIFDATLNLIDWSIVPNSNQFVRFVSLFDRSTFVSKHFQSISKHFSPNLRQIQNFIEEFLSSENLFFFNENRIFSVNDDLSLFRQIVFLLDLVDIHNTDVLKTLLSPILENIRTAYQRPYTSVDRIRRSIELFHGLINEHYFHSINFIKDWISSSLRLIVREALSFVKLHAVSRNQIDFDASTSPEILGQTTGYFRSVGFGVSSRRKSRRHQPISPGISRIFGISGSTERKKTFAR